MNSEQESAEALLDRLIEEREPGTRESVLAELLFVRAKPVISRIVGRRLECAPPQDREDVTGEVIVALLNRFSGASREDPAAIDRFFGYVSATTNNACDQYYRKRFPERHRLKNRVYYLVNSSPHFCFWEDDAGHTLCGANTDRARRPTAMPPATIAGQIAVAGKTPSELLHLVFQQAGGPLELDTLVEIFASLWGIKDQPAESDADFENRSGLRTDPNVLLDQRRALARLWAEMGQLPVPQRAALLLNLRDRQGSSALPLLPLAGIATVREIAAALAMPSEDFASLWSRLPLDDQEIATRLGVTRQQVINLRLAARQRLHRRMEKQGFRGSIY